MTEQTNDTSDVIIPDGFPPEVYESIQKNLRAKPHRALAFQNEKQRNAAFIQKGLSKPGKISYDVLRRTANSVHIARICINTLKEKITKTKWVIQPKDQLKQVDEEKIDEVTNFFKYPNPTDSFRTLLDKMLEDLLVLDAVSLEKTRFPDGKLAQLFFVDAATIRPVFDEYGNIDIEIPLKTEKEGNVTLPVSYVQILNNSQYGGPESGDIIAAWPYRDMVYFHQHPQGAMDAFGYGLSPLEGVISVVANILNADNFNSTYFEEGAFPPIIIQLIGSVNQRDLEAYREYMNQELTGNFHRPALMATKSAEGMKVHNLKDMTNRDMEFMDYMMFLGRLLCAAYGMSGQDIGLTDEVGSKNVAETQKDLSEGKGYGSILGLIKEQFNELISQDFGYKDIEFEWVAPDSTEPDIASQIYDRALKNGTLTVNEVRQKTGEAPFGKEFDIPMILGSDGYSPLIPEKEEEVEGEKPVEVEKMKKAIYTSNNYKTWADDRGYSQPFIYMDIKSGWGQVIKPPVAVNFASQQLEQDLTAELAEMGLNVCPVRKMTFVEVRNMLGNIPEVIIEFEKYCMMTSEYDSEKWRAKFGGSRQFSYYLVSEYVDGLPLSNPLLMNDMIRDPASYRQAIIDLANLWKVEKDMLLGDRRIDQYLITPNKRAFGIDYQFKGDFGRWEKNADIIRETLRAIPELGKLFNEEIEKTQKSLGQKIKSIFKGYNRVRS